MRNVDLMGPVSLDASLLLGTSAVDEQGSVPVYRVDDEHVGTRWTLLAAAGQFLPDTHL